MGKKVTIKLETGTVYQKDEGGTITFVIRSGKSANASV